MMPLTVYLLLGILVLSATQLARSHRVMNLLAVGYSLASIGLAGYLYVHGPLPAGFFDGNFYLDHLSIYEIAISGLVFSLAAVYAKGHAETLMEMGLIERKNIKRYYLAFNSLLIFTVLSFAANNLALFWIFVELTTFFSAFLIAIINTRKNIDAAIKYIFMTSTAMLFSFIGLILLFALTQKASGNGTLNWDDLAAQAASLPALPLSACFAFIFIGYAAKSGIAPFHTALPHVYSKAPSAVSTILSAAMLNIGIYGILRICAIVRLTEAWGAASNLLLAFGILSIFIAAFSMLQQRNLKKLIAFSSTEHAGLMLVGISLGTPLAVFWVLYHVLAHSLTKALLFFSAGILHRQYGSNKIENITDPAKWQPYASAGLIIGSIAIIGMPPSIVFISKISLLLQVAKYSLPLLLLILLLLLVAAAAFAVYMSRIFAPAGKEKREIKRYKAPLLMKIPIAILVILIIVLGVWFPIELKNLLDVIVQSLGFAGGARNG